MCKECTKIVTISEEIKIAGLSQKKSGLPPALESMGKLWKIYGDKYRYNVKNAIEPIVEYAVSLNVVPDYIAGCGNV